MVRSLSFIHLFVILAVGYIGGALLFREMPATAIERVITFYDARVVQGHDAGYIRPVGTAALFFVVVFVLSSFRKTRFTVLFFGAVKCVLFGLSSSYLTWFRYENDGLFNLVVSVSVHQLFSVSSVLCSPQSALLYAYDIGKKTQYTCVTDDNWLSVAVLAIEIIVFQFIIQDRIIQLSSLNYSVTVSFLLS